MSEASVDVDTAEISSRIWKKVPVDIVGTAPTAIDVHAGEAANVAKEKVAERIKKAFDPPLSCLFAVKESQAVRDDAL